MTKQHIENTSVLCQAAARLGGRFDEPNLRLPCGRELHLNSGWQTPTTYWVRALQPPDPTLGAPFGRPPGTPCELDLGQGVAGVVRVLQKYIADTADWWAACADIVSERLARVELTQTAAAELLAAGCLPDPAPLPRPGRVIPPGGHGYCQANPDGTADFVSWHLPVTQAAALCKLLATFQKPA
jgi:hypothetical protein